MRRLILSACLLAPVAAAWGQSGVIDVPMDKGWGATPEWAPYEKAATFSQTYADGAASFRASGGGRVMIWCHNPLPRLDVSRMRYVTLRYRLTDTDPTLYSYLLYLDTGDSGTMLARNLIFGANDLIHDGQWHVATTTLYPFGQVGSMALRFQALEGKEGRLDVAYLRFTADPPRQALRETLAWRPGELSAGETPIAIDALCRESLADAQQALDLSDWFTSETVSAEGIGFRVPLQGPVAIATSEEKKERVTVPVGRRAAALCLLMGARFRYQMLGYEGWAPGDMTDRPEQFQVTIRYADNTQEEEVPHCLGQGRHGVWRGVRAYVLPVAPEREVKEIELWDGMQTSSFHLLALTATARSVVPEPSEVVQRTPAGRPQPQVEPLIGREGSGLIVRTRSGELRLSLSPGPVLAAASNAAHPEWLLRVERAPLFSVRENDSSWTSDTFAVSGPVEVAGRTAKLTLQSDAAQVAAELSMEVSRDEALFRLRVRNLADPPRTLDVTFPEVQLTHERAMDLWYLYPSMCPAWSNADGRYDKPYSGWFPVQFEDIYDRARGGGLYVGTRDQSLRQRYYQLRKTGGTVTARIEYRLNPPLPPGQWVEYPATVIGLHGGSWRPAWEAYRRWFASWYRPQRPRLDWYRKLWNFRTWWVYTMGDGRPEHNLLNLKTGEYQTSTFLQRDREQFGQVDMIHFFDWRISKQYGAYGDFSHYEDIGGLERFRAAVKYLQDQGVRVGLYLDCYLCSRKSLIGQEHGEEWAVRRQDGSIGDAYSSTDDPMLNMCVLHPGWQDHLARTCARVVQETGCDGIYLDEGMTDYEAYWCWSKDHGHPVPGTNQAGLLELARKVRAALPPGTALYTEWSPPDAFIPQLDGAYQAALGRSDGRVSPGFLQLARFAFPDFRVFTISSAGHMYDGIWEGTKFNLFNGVPLYSLSWGHDDEWLPLCRKMSKILHDHQDAFLTPNPHPWIDTERREVYCNEFPGSRETVWTFWNGRYRTVTGRVLRVKHIPGAKYLDLWNDRDLKPTIEGATAVLNVPLGPRGIGAVAQVRR